MSDPCIHIKDLGVRIGDVSLLEGIELRAEVGERIAVLGASGSGKTTLLRVIAGLEERMVTGSIELEGKLVSRVGESLAAPHERDISMLFQDLALWPHMSVREHLAFPLGEARLEAGEATARIGEILDAVGLREREESLPAELSGGEKQRLALARALVSRPKRLLLDEPFSSLDGLLRKDMTKLLLRLHEERGFTLLHVTHDPLEAMKIGSRILLLESGKIAWTGSSEALRHPTQAVPKALIETLDWWTQDPDPS